MGIIPANNLLLNLLVIAVSFLILAKSADFLVEGAVGIAAKLRVPEIVVGIVLVGFATTAPEFTVSLISAIEGYPEIALGNAVGSVIADNALALALGILVAPAAIIIHSRILSIYGIFLLCVSVLAFGLALDRRISRLDGIILLILLVAYLSFVFFDRKKSAEIVQEDTEEQGKMPRLSLQILQFGVGVGGIILAGRFLVDAAVNIAAIFNVAEAVIGLTIVAIGTSLPEIATCIVACRRGHGDLAFGDILGANLLNILWIIGAAATANPITVSHKMVVFSFPSMLFFVVVLLYFSKTGSKLSKWEGFALLGLYGLYTALAIHILYVQGGSSL